MMPFYQAQKDNGWLLGSFKVTAKYAKRVSWKVSWKYRNTSKTLKILAGVCLKSDNPLRVEWISNGETW